MTKKAAPKRVPTASQRSDRRAPVYLAIEAQDAAAAVADAAVHTEPEDGGAGAGAAEDEDEEDEEKRTKAHLET